MSEATTFCNGKGYYSMIHLYHKHGRVCTLDVYCTPTKETKISFTKNGLANPAHTHIHTEWHFGALS